MTTLFDRITQLSIRFRWITIALTVAFLTAGILSLSGLNLELTPRVEFPQTIVIVQWPDSESSEQFLQEITIPLEDKLSVIEGVINVESTTNPGFGLIIARYDFGLNSAKMLENIENAIAETDLPETADPQVLNFSLSDLPVVVASISSSELTLAELKEAVEADLQPQLANLEQVSEVAIGGGQELPDETVAEEPAIEEEVVEAEPTDPGRLPFVVIEGAKQLGIEVEYAQDVTPELLQGLNGTEEQVMAVLRLIPVDILPYAPAETLSLLPSELVATFDADLVAQLDELAAVFGGVGQYTLTEVTALINGESLEPEVVAKTTDEEEVEGEEPTMEETTEEVVEAQPIVELPAPDPIALPDSWLAAAAAGFPMTTTADITPEIMEGIVGFAPQLLNDLTPEMWRVLDPAAALAALPQAAADLDPSLLFQLQAIQFAANGLAPEPVALPTAWTVAAEYAGLTISTTADIPAPALALIAESTPELLDTLTPEMILAFAPDVQAALPVDYLTGLDEGLQQTLAVVAIQTERAAILAANAPADVPTITPVPLPAEWVAAAAAQGVTITDTSDITPEFMGGIMGFAPDMLGLLTPEMWRAFDPAVTAVALPTIAETFDSQLLAQLAAIQFAANGIAPDPAPLPESWIAAAGAGGFAIATTADIPADAFGLLVGTAPQLLADLTEEVLLALPAEALAALPADYVAGLDEGLQQTITNITIVNAQYLAQTSSGEEVAEEPAKDPGRLPDLLIAGLAQAGVAVEYAQDIDPDLMRLLGSFGPQASQFLGVLTPDHLRLMQPEVIALLPADFVDGLDADLRAELDELAVEFGGAGQLAIAEAEAADPARLPDILIQGAAQAGTEIEFAQDLTPDLVRLFGGLGEQATQILGLLTPDHLRLMPAESIALLPMSFLETLDADLRAELDELAAEFGGAGQLAIEEAEAAAALSEGAPVLTGAWTQPGPNGEEPLFKTAADFLTSGFAPTAAELLNFIPLQAEDPPALMGDLTPDVIAWLADNEEGFVSNLDLPVMELMSPETLSFMLETYPDAFDAATAERLQGIASGSIKVFIPESSVTRTDGNPSVIISIYKDGDANTVEVAHRIFDVLDAYTAANPDIASSLVFEQATFIEDSIAGVSREGALGGVFAILVILIFLSGHVGGHYKLSWRATVVSGISIPLSIFTALFLMRWMPSTVGTWLQGLVDVSNSDTLAFIARLFPTSITLNIMTLSGLTVAIGRVVDDSIVVLENSYRFIQRGDDPKTAVIRGTKEVAVAIFSATVTTMAVFLPLGLIGGLIGTFFLPFGLTVTYALAASFIVSITVVPALTYMLIRKEHIPEEKETGMQRWYTPILKWCLTHRGATLGIAAVIFLGSLFLLTRLPQSFIPSLGEPTINVTVGLPSGTPIVETNTLVEGFEAELQALSGLEKIQTEVGSGGGLEALFGGGGVTQNAANITISAEDQDELANLTNTIRAMAQDAFGEDNVQVSAASQTGFGGFTLILTGESLDELRALIPSVKEALESVDLEDDGIADIANVASNVDNEQLGGSDTIIRIDGRPAISFSGELETQNTLGVTAAAKTAITDLGLPAGVEVTEGFDSQQQTEGFKSMITGIGYSIIIVYLVMAITFRSLIHPFTILFSLPFALVGAAVALYITNSVLGISAMIGLMMLVGIVVTNGIVLMELVQQLRARGENAYDALIEGGRTRLRPIWMTALTAILALIPLAASQEAGAIIASELARAVMGGLLVSTALTLVVIPVIYSLFDQLGSRLRRK